MPPKVTAACQLASRKAKRIRVGQYCRLRAPNFVMRAMR